MYQAIRPLLFAATQEDAERAHDIALAVLKYIQRRPRLLAYLEQRYSVKSAALERTVCDIQFPNPIGLAAGFDKNAIVPVALQALGFGFTEIGTVLPDCGQPGNSRPRIFRLPKDEALVNRMGFNSDGAMRVERRLAACRKKMQVPIGVNIGKLRNTPLDRAHLDYGAVFDQLYLLADYFTINVSSPNTPGLRKLQGKELLANLLDHVHKIRENKVHRGLPRKPIFLKTSPDLTEDEFEKVLAVIEQKADGVICSNTTVSRKGLATNTNEEGGLSGKPLHEMGVAQVSRARAMLPAIPIIGCAGVDGYDAYQRMADAGANLVQLYTALVYKGFAVPFSINKQLVNETM